MRSAVLLFLTAFPLFPQTNDAKTLDTLLSEVRELRLAIERSTLLGTRTQLLLSQLQLQEAAVARVAQQYSEVKSQGPGAAGNVARITEQLKHLEESRTSPEWSSSQKHDELESIIKQQKLNLDQATVYEQQRAARESDLALQLQQAQAQVADARARIAEMERSLDAAIQQLMKQR